MIQHLYKTILKEIYKSLFSTSELLQYKNMISMTLLRHFIRHGRDSLHTARLNPLYSSLRNEVIHINNATINPMKHLMCM